MFLSLLSRNRRLHRNQNTLNLNAGTVTQTVELQGTGTTGPQTITFPNPGTQTYGVSPITLTATASSGLPVSYAVTSGPATVSGSTLTITGVGLVTVQASQAGNANYYAAPPVSVTFTVGILPRVLTLPTTVVGTTAVTVGIVNPNWAATTYWFEYSTSEGFREFLQTSHQTLSAGPNESAVGAWLTGLASHTVYHYRLVAQNIAGISLGRMLEFSSGGQNAPSSSTSTISADSAVSQTGTAAISSASSPLTTPTVRNTNTTNTRAATTVSTQTAILEVMPGRSMPLVVSLAGVSEGKPVTATCANLPEGATCSYDDNTQTVTITPSASTPSGNYQLDIVVVAASETD